MLDEYDFRGGIRGKYYQQYQNNNLKPLRGVQFIIDTRGRKTGAILDLNEHQNLWQDCLNQFGFVNAQYLVNCQDEKLGIVLDFKKDLLIWKIIYDRLIAELMD